MQLEISGLLLSEPLDHVIAHPFQIEGRLPAPLSTGVVIVDASRPGFGDNLPEVRLKTAVEPGNPAAHRIGDIVGRGRESCHVEGSMNQF